MASITSPPTTLRRPDPRVVELKPSLYEKTSTWLTAILLLFGSITFIMFVIWLSSRMVWDRPVAKVTSLEDVGGGSFGDNPLVKPEFDEPVTEEVPEIEEPKVEQSLDSISEVVVAQTVTLESLTPPRGFGRGEGTGIGDGRGAGSGPGTAAGTPAWERWEIRFNATDLDVYKRQLDFFKVELGIAGGGIPHIDYLKNFTAATPTKRQGSPRDEKRLFFIYKSGALKQADRQLASEAGININGRVVMQFYTQEMYNTLLRLEHEQMGKRSISDVVRTVFGVRPAGGGYEFYVIGQDYRSGVAPRS
jgi:hypothetical protein